MTATEKQFATVCAARVQSSVASFGIGRFDIYLKEAHFKRLSDQKLILAGDIQSGRKPNLQLCAERETPSLRECRVAAHPPELKH